MAPAEKRLWAFLPSLPAHHPGDSGSAQPCSWPRNGRATSRLVLKTISAGQTTGTSKMSSEPTV